ncbi:disease resistance RPP13-like protein 4 [Rhododendron vialii]|uniref:disease resistance RPP13-like protein 4 n=1 Tax=Rhododendron vialii TaxID=182163 RepID=UPI00265F031A|nr:disease resistance RPP13-like protein 4 [Rhododendron vialii]
MSRPGRPSRQGAKRNKNQLLSCFRLEKKGLLSCLEKQLPGLSRKRAELARGILLSIPSILTCVKDFRKLWDFDDFKKFICLQKLTISWGGCSFGEEFGEERRILSALFTQGPLILPPILQKLDFQCFPEASLTNWLRPAERLKKLYIRGGLLCDLDQIQKRQGEWWNVEILRLKYLSKLKIDWSELRILFPKLIYLQQEECPKLSNSPCDERGVWMNMEAIDSHMQ